MLNPGAQISLSAWIYTYTAGSALPETIISKGIGTATPYSLAIEPGGTLRFTLKGSALTTARKVSPNSWTHVFASFDGETMRIYLNSTADCGALTFSRIWPSLFRQRFG